MCIGRQARLLFHGGHKVVSTSAANHMLAAYKPRLRNYLVSNGYMKTVEFHTISGADMITKFGYRECPKS